MAARSKSEAQLIERVEELTVRVATLEASASRNRSELITIKEAMRRYGAHERTARRWAAKPGYAVKAGGRVLLRVDAIEQSKMS